MKLLEMKNVKKSFGDTEVLSDISLDVSEGEVVAILGPSGSGKSTLLRCATLLEVMDKGELTYNGINVAKTVDGKCVYENHETIMKAKECFGLVFQDFQLFPHYTALKNIMDAPIHVQKREKEEVEKEAMELLNLVELNGKENNYPCQLSGGQKQRVAIARALALNPKVLFFDEPTSALDPEITAGILRLLKKLAAEKMTMIIVTHEIEFARNIADRVIFMDGGVIVEEGKPEDVIDNPDNERTQKFLQSMRG